MVADRLIMGIDPGTNILGWAVICIKGKSVSLVDMGIIDLRKERDHFIILKRILIEVGDLIDRFKPDHMALEAPFYGKNIQIMQKLGRAQGAAIAAGLYRDIPLYEYAPKKIKMAVTGSGSASKEQVATILEKTLKHSFTSEFLDTTDALAVAMCHYYQLSNPLSDTSTSTNWESFIKSNPGRVKK